MDPIRLTTQETNKLYHRVGGMSIDDVCWLSIQRYRIKIAQCNKEIQSVVNQPMTEIGAREVRRLAAMMCHTYKRVARWTLLREHFNRVRFGG